MSRFIDGYRRWFQGVVNLPEWPARRSFDGVFPAIAASLAAALAFTMELSPTAAQEETRSGPTPVFFMPIQVDKPFVGVAGTLLDQLTAELTRTGVYGETATAETARAAQECVRKVNSDVNSESCWVRLGLGQGAKLMVTGRITGTPANCAVTLKLVALETRVSVHQHFRRLKPCDEEALADDFEVGARELAGQGAPQRTPGPAVAPEQPVVQPTVGGVGNLAIEIKPFGKVRLELTDPAGRSLPASGSPYRSASAAVGSWALTATAPGFEPIRQPFSVAAGETTAVKLELEPLGALEVSGDPPAAAVHVEGPGGFANDGGLPWQAHGLPSGVYQIRIDQAGYQSSSQEAAVRPGKTTQVRVALVAERARPSVAPQPTGFVRIQAGTFTMGSPSGLFGGEEDRESNELQHEVRLTRPFLLKTTETTQAQWQEVMGSNPARNASCGGECPVEYVTWYQAILFCNLLSEREGLEICYGDPADGRAYGRDDAEAMKTPSWPRGLDCGGYRLPTEAEWEYSARAGTAGPRYGASLESIAWATDGLGGKSHPVGRKRPNQWGLLDMLGNVEEWCWDVFGEYPEKSLTDPLGPTSEGGRVIRGGYWLGGTRFTRAAARGHYAPSERFEFLGFRVARTAAR